jgi:asparagine synthase (glutamine-hydrolysing)
MCGLVGIWKHDGGEVEQSAIAPMLATIEHRGPDGMGIWQEGRVAFGHRRLAILDLTEASAQPMLTEDRTGILVYNGEVYNYRELRQELEKDGIRFRSSGDVEVVLHALHHWGPERSLIRFDGMFAFAYLDRRQGALWLARDRVGIKPLLISNTGAEWLFASEAKALLAHSRMETRADRHAISNWLLASSSGSHRMPFVGIDEVAPGACWKITEKGIEKHQYFHALTAVDVDRIVAASSRNPRAFVNEFQDHLKKSVKLHLVSDVPLAAMCSGGIDSSLIAAYAKDESPEITGYVADTWPGGEGEQAERVGRHLGIPIHRVVVDQMRYLTLWPYTVWHCDGPPTHRSAPALLAVAKTCRADGIKVLLTGEGSDELFGGYRAHQATYDQWSLLRSWRRHLFRSNLSREALGYAPFAGGTILARSDPGLRNRITIALDADKELLPQRFMALLSPIEPEADRAFIAHNLCSLYRQLSWIIHRHDRIGMAASMEMRVPFLENDMFDLAFHLPRRATLHRHIKKWLVKQAAAEILPEDIVYATKRGFPMPKAFTLGTQHILAGGMLAELFEWPAKTTEEIISLIGKDDANRFHIVGLELWARIFFGGEKPAALGERLIALAADSASRTPKVTTHRERQEPVRLISRAASLLRSLPSPRAYSNRRRRPSGISSN